jgi:hypothetical protein
MLYEDNLSELWSNYPSRFLLFNLFHVRVVSFSKKTVVVSLWNDLATKEGEKLLDMVNDSPVVLIKGLRVSDFQGMCL